MRFPLFLLTCVLLFGCAAPPTPAPGTAGSWGYFTGPFNVRLDENGRQLHLLNDVSYTAPDGIVWTAPAGWTIDGASIPKPFWSIIGGPLEGRYRNASIFHDVACDRRDRPWDKAAMMFYQAMRCGGASEEKSKIMYYAVYRFGPHWGSGSTMAAKNVGAPRPPTQEDVERIKNFVKEKNPGLNEIQADAQKSKP